MERKVYSRILLNKYAISFVFLLAILAILVICSSEDGNQSSLAARAGSVVSSVREQIFPRESQSEPLEAPSVRLARKFVQLISTYRPEWAERQFEQAKNNLSPTARALFEEKMIDTELTKIKQSSRSQMFFVPSNLIKAGRYPDSNIVVVQIPGISQTLIDGEPQDTQKVLYEIELTALKEKIQSEDDILITRFWSQEISDQEYAAKATAQLRKKERMLGKRLPISEVPEGEFHYVARRFVNLIGNFQPVNAQERFAAAREYVIEAAYPQYDDKIFLRELPAIQELKRSQMFFVNSELSWLERYPEADEAVVSLTGMRQTFFMGEALPADQMIYELTLTTVSGTVRNPYGIVITQVIHKGPMDPDSGVEEAVEKPLDLKTIKLALEQDYTDGMAEDKQRRRTRLKEQARGRTERKESGMLLSVRRLRE